MKKLLSILLAAVLFLGVGMISSANAEKSPSIDVSNEMVADLRLATLSMGSTWYTYGALMAEQFTKEYPNVIIDVLPNSGGTGNMKLLARGEAEIGLGFGYSDKWAFEGTAAFEGEPLTMLRGLVGALDDYYIGIVARKATGITSIQDIIDRKIPVRWLTIETGSAGEYANRQILEAYDLSYEKIKEFGGSVEHTDFATIVNMFKDGKADVFAQVITKGHPALTELAVSTEVNFIELSDEALEKLAKYGYLSGHIPSGSFKGQDNDVQTAYFSTTIVTTDSLPDEIAYAFTKCIVENISELQLGHTALKGFRIDDCYKEEIINLPLHPGARQYYIDSGMLVP